LLFVDLGRARNVVPIIDSGETEHSWVLVMPRADKSLRQYIEENGTAIDPDEVVRILTDIVAALVDLSDTVVHRDLKPENILLLNGNWCLADFGISRYTEATTAPDTQKFALSPPYAAPERWRSERATISADIYAVGVVGYEMLSGSQPFSGPSLEDFREQHLHTDPPILEGIGSRLASLVEECLIKAPEARPRPANLLARLERVPALPRSPGLARLQEADRADTNRRAALARKKSLAVTEAERREALFDAASQQLRRMSDRVRSDIMVAAPSAIERQSPNGNWNLYLNSAELRFYGPSPCDGSWGSWHAPVFDVVAETLIMVQVPPNQLGYSGRSHALWFCDAQVAGDYKWFETAFMLNRLMVRPETSFGLLRPETPFGLSPDKESAGALWSKASIQVAWPFTPLQIDRLDDFISRWAQWFANGSEGQLDLPTKLPERSPKGSYRTVAEQSVTKSIFRVLGLTN
jgi:eukaryotic-like serine/threonine-protein kinase